MRNASMRTRSPAAWLAPCLLLALSPCLAACRGDFDEVIDSPMYKDPDLPAPAGDGDLRDLVEPALARWDYRPARATWLERLRDAQAAPRDILLAIRGLAAVREVQAADRLREIALSADADATVRLEAARALG